MQPARPVGRVYRYFETVERLHAISIRRALGKVLQGKPDWRWGRRTRRNRAHGGERVLYNRHSRYAHNFEYRWRR